MILLTEVSIRTGFVRRSLKSDASPWDAADGVKRRRRGSVRREKAWSC
jgi:hypothetical protein